MRRWERVAALAGAVAVAVLWSVPAWGTATASGQWTYTRGGVTCKFGGVHETINPSSRGRTNDVNGACNHLRVRFKSKDRTSGVVTDWGWFQTTGSVPANAVEVTVTNSIAVASQHQAQNGFDLSWSPIQQPHAY